MIRKILQGTATVATATAEVVLALVDGRTAIALMEAELPVAGKHRTPARFPF